MSFLVFIVLWTIGGFLMGRAVAGDDVGRYFQHLAGLSLCLVAIMVWVGR